MSQAHLQLEKLVSSEINYEKLIKETMDKIKKDKDMDATFKKIILFCKFAFSVNFAQRKKYLCLNLIKDICECLKSSYFEKIMDENIPIKLLKTISNEVTNKGKESRHQDDQNQYTERLVTFAIETITFWNKKLSYLPGKTQFSQAYDQLKKMKLEIPKNFQYYQSEKLTLGIWGDRDENSEEYVKNEDLSPVLMELNQRFTQCKALIEQKINEAFKNEEELYLKTITQKLREFLLLFFSRYKNLQAETSLDRDVLIVYFHIMNSLFKRICSKFYIPVKEMISLTREVFEGDHNSDFNTVDRMDMVNLAGIYKYNALSIFQRIHQRIEQQESKLGTCDLTFDQKEEASDPTRKELPDKKEKSPEDKKNPKFKR